MQNSIFTVDWDAKLKLAEAKSWHFQGMDEFEVSYSLPFTLMYARKYGELAALLDSNDALCTELVPRLLSLSILTGNETFFEYLIDKNPSCVFEAIGAAIAMNDAKMLERLLKLNISRVNERTGPFSFLLQATKNLSNRLNDTVGLANALRIIELLLQKGCNPYKKERAHDVFGLMEELGYSEWLNEFLKNKTREMVMLQ